MKILFISHSSDYYGAERCLWEAVAALIEQGVTVEAVVPAPGELSERLRALSTPVHFIPHTWWVGFGHWRQFYYRMRRRLQNYFVAPRFARLLRQGNFDLVVSNTLTIPAGAFAARRTGIPHVWFVQEFGLEDHDFHFDLGATRSFALMNQLSARVIANSHAVAKNLSPYIPQEKLRVVYQSVEVVPQSQPTRPPEVNEVLRLISVGRLAAGKRQEDAIRALALLVKKGLNLRLTLAGPDVVSYGQEMRKLAQDLDVAQHIDFVGDVSDPQSYLLQSEVALICSRCEAFGRVTIEAMKAGKPVVGANTAGTAELICDGVNGFTFKMGDSEDLARKIEILYHDPSLRKEMGRRGEQWAAENFTREKFGADLLRVFNEIAPANKNSQFSPLRSS